MGRAQLSATTGRAVRGCSCGEKEAAYCGIWDVGVFEHCGALWYFVTSGEGSKGLNSWGSEAPGAEPCSPVRPGWSRRDKNIGAWSGGCWAACPPAAGRRGPHHASISAWASLSRLVRLYWWGKSTWAKLISIFLRYCCCLLLRSTYLKAFSFPASVFLHRIHLARLCAFNSAQTEAKTAPSPRPTLDPH